MAQYYLLSAIGPDQPGLVAKVSRVLYEQGCNLEDSSMMRLGSEFGMMLIFTSTRKLNKDSFSSLEKSHKLTIHVKTISKRLAHFKPAKKIMALVTIYGVDRPGLVFHATRLLAQHKFNITDLSTHRTEAKRQAGYILFIEGELTTKSDFLSIQKELTTLASKLKIHITIQRVNPATI